MSISFALHGESSFKDAFRQRITEAGFTETPEPAAADIVVNYGVGESAIEDLYFGDGGFLQMLKPGTVIVDASAMPPNFAREVSAVATVSDLLMVEAPMAVIDPSLEDAFAKDNLFGWMAGEDKALESARMLVEAMYGTVRETGTPGSAQLSRAAYTLQIAAQVISAIEADALFRAARRMPIGSAMVQGQPEALSKTAGVVMKAIEDRRFAGPYTVAMFMSELTCALTAADDAELILPQAEAALHLLELLSIIGGADMAPTSLALIYGDEESSAAEGLDWTRAEEVYQSAADMGGFDGYDDDIDSYDDFDDGQDYEGFDYSNN